MSEIKLILNGQLTTSIEVPDEKGQELFFKVSQSMISTINKDMLEATNDKITNDKTDKKKVVRYSCDSCNKVTIKREDGVATISSCYFCGMPKDISDFVSVNVICSKCKSAFYISVPKGTESVSCKKCKSWTDVSKQT